MHCSSKSDAYSYSHHQLNSTENQQLADPDHSHPQIDKPDFAHYYGSPQLAILSAPEDFEDGHQPTYQYQSDTTHVDYHQLYSPTTLHHAPFQVHAFNHGHRRSFDEFAEGERVEMSRVYRPLVLPGRVYVPPMDLRNLNPEEAHAMREHVLGLRRQNLEAELRGDFDQHETRRQEWTPYLLQRLVLFGAAVTLIPTAFVCAILYGAVKSGRFAYRNSHHIRGTFVLVVESTFNAAKRRLVTVSGLVSIPRRSRSNLRPPPPRRRNGVIRQPPMTSNLARWEDELRARREEPPVVMQGVEPDPASVSDYMMSGAIMDLAEGDCINPHYNPLYTPLPIDTTAFDDCVMDVVHPNAPIVSFAANRNDGEDGDLYMIDAEGPSSRPQSESVRHGFTDFSSLHLVESHDSGSNNQIVIVNNANAGGSSSSESATYTSAGTLTPPFPTNISSSSVPAITTGAIDSDTSNFSNPPESNMHKPQQASIGSTNREFLMSTRADDTHSDLSDDAEPPKLPRCNFQGDGEQSVLMEIDQVANANTELGLNVSIPSDDATTISSAQAETSIHTKSTGPLEAVLASNVIQPRQSKGVQLSHAAVNFSAEGNEEPIRLSSSTQKARTQSQESRASNPLQSVPSKVHEEEFGLTLTIPGIQRESHQILPVSAAYPPQTEGQEYPSSPGYSDEEKGVESFLSSSSRFEITDQRAPSKTPVANLGQHGISPPEFTPAHGFEQENFPLSPERLESSIPISSVQILEQESSGQTTPIQSDGQPSPLSSVSPMGLPDQQSSPPSPARSVFSLSASSIPNRKQWSPKSNTNTPKRILKKSVTFFQSPKTGRPITKTKRFISGEPIGFPVSSSPAPNSVASTESSIVEFDSPTTIAETDTSVHSFAQHDDPTTPVSLHHLADKGASKEGEEPETVSLAIEPSESAGVLTYEVRNNEEVTLEVIGSVAGSLEADKPAAAKARAVEADAPTAERIGAVQTEESSLAGADELGFARESSELTADSSSVRADKLVIDKDPTQETAGSSLDEADKPAVGEDVVVDWNEPSETTSGDIHLRQLHDTLKLARSESSRRKSSPNRQSVQPARKSTRLQNKGARISLPPQGEMSEKLPSLGLSGGYDTTAITSKHDRRVFKAEQARLKQAAIEAAEEARRAKKEAEDTARREAEAKEKARQEEEERQKRFTRRIPKEKVIRPLTAEWEAKVKAAMNTPDMQTVLVTLSSGTKLTRKDFGTLKAVQGRDPAHGWLNDEIILASLQQVVDYGLRISNHEAGKTPKYHVFNTFFYKNLRDKGAQSVKRWATKAKIGGRALEEVERVFIPVHQVNHWTLLVISPIARTIEYFDSFGGHADPYIHHAKSWLATEMGARFKENEWAVPTGAYGRGPRQRNMSDCGVFLCTTARMVTLGVDPMTYGAEDMGVQRGRMMAELLNGGLFGDFDPKVEF